MTDENTFDKMEKQDEQTTPTEDTQTTEPIKEYSIDSFDDVAIGDKKKYVRPDLNGKKDIIKQFVVEIPDTTKKPTAQTDSSTYWKVTSRIIYESKNADGLQNREFISGAKVFLNRSGDTSPPQFWYKGSKTQMAYLWDIVATAKKIAPEKLSPREFIAFLNSKPGVMIIAKEYDNFIDGRKQGLMSKNMPEKFL